MPTEPMKDLVTEARELLETHSIVAMRVDKPYKEIRPLIAGLCDEVERLRQQVKQMAQDARDDAQAAANEARWSERQGEDYGSY